LTALPPAPPTPTTLITAKKFTGSDIIFPPSYLDLPNLKPPVEG